MASARGSITAPEPAIVQADTPYASPSSDLISTSSTTIISNPTPRSANSKKGSDQSRPNNRPRNPSLSVRDRALSSASTSSTSSVRRKPLPLTASPLATRFSSVEHLAKKLDPPDQPFVRPYSIDSPTLYEFPPSASNSFAPPAFSPGSSGTLKQTKDIPATTLDHDSKQTSLSESSCVAILEYLPTLNSPNLAIPSHTRSPTSDAIRHAKLNNSSTHTSTSESSGPWPVNSSSTSLAGSTTMSIFSAKPTPPHKINTLNASLDAQSGENHSANSSIPKSPRSPGPSKLGAFFGWGSASSPVSPTTTFSEQPYSPIPSPLPAEIKRDLTNASTTPPAKTVPKAIDIPKANAEAGYFGSAHIQLPLTTPEFPAQVEAMEKELREISAELAASIRREMDLEDLVERLQAEGQSTSIPNKRTSDYFSDSGTSSVRYGDYDARQDELDRMQRKTEQEKAQMRLELTNKVQDERGRRKQLESQIRLLEEKASHVEIASLNSVDTNDRLKDLEATCEDLRRRLADERQVKENFEDLLAALKSELESSHNERDNLRDEIVPQLRARVEGLEAQAVQQEKLTYDQTKLQQEFQSLQAEHTSLINAHRQPVDMQQQMQKFNTIVEDVTPLRARPSGMTRSNSLAQGSRSSLGRSNTVKVTESREALAERVKDIELQRDSLHQALKNLRERQDHQNRENQKKIRQLEMERDKALTGSPKRVGYNKEVEILRMEINTLRRRADEAIEQKWQCEKGLSGLKMDLDRAEQEISSLRSLLQERDILVANGNLSSSNARPDSAQASSKSLELAYRDLQKAYAKSLDRIKDLELSAMEDVDTSNAMRRLEHSLSSAISGRDFAQREAESYQEQTTQLKDSEKKHIDAEQALADELRGSAKRVEELAAQVRQQLATNTTLRGRLAETIERGEKEQRLNAQKITYMQSKLKSLEDQLMAAQQASEETISRHEEEIRELKESHNAQLQRTKDGLRSPRSFSPKSPLSPLFANTSKTPRLSRTTSGQAVSVSEDSKVEFLKTRVLGLEAALADADREMEEVVGRMNIAQIEVMELQNEREEAVRETKRLQKVIEEERLKVFESRFASLQNLQGSPKA